MKLTAYDILTNISRDENERARFRARRKFQMDIDVSENLIDQFCFIW
jgi:hypothetical protein